MQNSYNDITRFSRPQYDDLYPMPMPDRAAQLSAFAALVGYGDAVEETARLVDSRIELTEDEQDELNINLNRLLGILDEQPTVTVTYFLPDERKQGGKYVTKAGTVRIYDSYDNVLVFTDGERIAVNDMYCVHLNGSGTQNGSCEQ